MNLSKQEKKFADEYVFRFFHAPAVTVEMRLESAKYAGYAISGNHAKDDAIVNSLLEKSDVKAYIAGEIERFRKILDDDQARALWNHISEFVPGEPEDGTTGRIYLH